MYSPLEKSLPQAVEESENTNLPQVVEDLHTILFSKPWGHHRYIIDKCSEDAHEVNIQIMRALVSMRHFMVNNATMFSRLETIEYHQLENLQHQQDTDKHFQESDKRIEEVFRRLHEGNAKPKQGVFYTASFV